jgi:hypothetical protein
MLSKQTASLDKLTIWDKLDVALELYNVSIKLIKKDDNIVNSHLSFQVTSKVYRSIVSQSLFNLNPKFLRLHSHRTYGNFEESYPIEIEVFLKPNLLTHLLKYASNAQEAANYLLNLSHQQSEKQSRSTNQKINTLLKTESWICLSVKQQQESGEVEFTTFLNFINHSTVNQADITNDKIIEKLIDFAKEWTDSNLLETSQNTTTPLSTDFKEILERLGGVLNESIAKLEGEEHTETPIANFAEATQNSNSQLFQEIADSFEKLIDSGLAELENKSQTASSLFTTVTNFFEKEDWSSAKIPEHTAIRLVFRGKNGQWNCYAKVNEDQRIFVFYSVCPLAAPESKRTAIAEFIARANYGMLIGNFELDFTDGEIRYKTSIDVQGDFLSFELIKQLVYANVTMMDEYLPGIMSVIHSDVLPEDAIAQIEGQPE